MYRHLRDDARDLLERECCTVGVGASGRRILASALDDMLEMLDESHDQPADRLEPVIRRLVTERQFAEDAGDPVVEADADHCVGQQVDVALRVLENVRHVALSRGLWSDVPVTPEMLG